MIQVWNGVTFVDIADAKVWNGSSFVTPDIWTWDGNFTKIWPPVGVALGRIGNGETEQFSSASDGVMNGFTFSCIGNCAIATVGGYRSSSAGMTFGVNYGATAMTPIGSIIWGDNNSGSNSSFVQWFGLMDPPSGAQTIQAWWDAGGFASPYMAVNVSSWAGVTSWAGPTAEAGTESGIALSLDVASNGGEMVLQCFMVENLTSTGGYPERAGDPVLYVDRLSE